MDRWDAAFAAELVEQPSRSPFGRHAVSPARACSMRPGRGGRDLSRWPTTAWAAPASRPNMSSRPTAPASPARRAYGLTEHSTVSVGWRDMPLEQRARTDGRLQPGSEVRIVDDAGRDLPLGARGRHPGARARALHRLHRPSARRPGLHRRRLVPHRRHRPAGRRGLPHHHRPQEGHRHPRRREHLVAGSGARAGHATPPCATWRWWPCPTRATARRSAPSSCRNPGSGSSWRRCSAISGRPAWRARRRRKRCSWSTTCRARPRARSGKQTCGSDFPNNQQQPEPRLERIEETRHPPCWSAARSSPPCCRRASRPRGPRAASASCSGRAVAIGAGADGSAARVIDGAKACVGAVNARGGINGRPIELITLDGGDPASHAKNARILVKEKGAMALLNCSGDATCTAVAQVARELQVPLVGPMSSSREMLRSRSRYQFPIRAANDKQAEALSRQMRAMGVSRAAILTDQPGRKRARRNHQAAAGCGPHLEHAAADRSTNPASFEPAGESDGRHGGYHAVVVDLQPETIDKLSERGLTDRPEWPRMLASFASIGMVGLSGAFPGASSASPTSCRIPKPPACRWRRSCSATPKSTAPATPSTSRAWRPISTRACAWKLCGASRAGPTPPS